MHIIQSLETKVRQLVEDINLGLLEFHMGTVHKKIHMSIVIYAQGRGIDVDDCSLVHSTLMQYIDKEEMGGEFNIEVLSPGATRTFKSMDEFNIFKGKRIRFLLNEPAKWFYAEILDADSETVNLMILDDIKKIEIEQKQFAKSNIKKAKLIID